MTPGDLTARLRELLADARAAAEGIDTAAADIHKLGMKIYLATSYPVAQQGEPLLLAAHEKAERAAEKLDVIGPDVDRAERELDRVSDRLGGLPGEGGAVVDSRIMVGAFRDMVDVARERTADYRPIVEGCVVRLRDFAAFDTASLHVWLDLEGADLESADEGLSRLRRLEFDLSTADVTAAVYELERRREMLG